MIKQVFKSKDIWLLLDGRAGNMSQVLGVGKALNLQYKEILYEYNGFSNIPNLLLQNTIIHIDSSYRDQFRPPWPKIVIGCGRRSAPVGQWIKRKSNYQTSYIQILWPGYPFKNIDLIAIPKHDKISSKTNTIEFLTSPHIFDLKYLSSSKKLWSNKLNSLPSPRIAVSIGGDTKKYKFLPSHSKLMINFLLKLIGTSGSLMITTSRRTSQETYEIIKNELKFLGDRLKIWNTGYRTKNPYSGFLSHADAVAVTGDSISLCSEACSTGKPVLIFAPKNITTEKQKYFHECLIKKGIAMYLEKADINKLKMINYTPLNESNKIAKEIKKRFLN